MTITEMRSFTHTFQKSKKWIDDVNEELRFNDEAKALVSLRAVLHALRDRLTVEEAADFGAQLPMLLLGVYYEGWKPAGKPVKMKTRQDFLDRVNAELTDNMNPDRIVRGVFRVFERHITHGEIEDIKNDLPRHIQELWES